MKHMKHSGTLTTQFYQQKSIAKVAERQVITFPELQLRVRSGVSLGAVPYRLS